jgi:pyruvate dehydrogenase E2 component (dihydrolipoyllysine-residue acetyltransferase)
MPALGADMESGTLVEWLIKPGDRVKRGDVVAVVETQKGAIEIEIFDEGLVSEIVAPVGTKVPVGGLLARIGGPAGPGAKQTPTPVPSREAVAPSLMGAPSGRAMPTAPRGKATPAARRRAAELGIDVGGLAGTGIKGAVTIDDVEAAVQQPALSAITRQPMRRTGFDLTEMRKAIAAAMGRSKREIPHYYLNHTIDLGRARGWLEQFNAAQSVPQRLLPAVLLLKASALALREVPQLNGTYTDGVFHPGDGVHVGWAISLRGGGLIAPAIRDADKMALPALMVAMRDLVGRARSGGLRSSELGSPTITVTSLGDRGVEMVTGIIYPPQVAIIGFGMVSNRPWVVEGRIEARPLVTASLAGDHRVSDGHKGALLLNAISRLLQEPETL